ncbi:unnamed protein product [Larinioides sclopetarius]|uniref:RING-type E3 ubiquitin transferase n=1 Tax=Larinioides sclopetarius TaxID=280406 RepID=A0AAV2B2S9_9ARAC
MDERTMEFVGNFRQALESVKASVRQLEENLERFVENRRHPGTSTASLSTTEAISETQGFHPMRFRFTTNAQEEASQAIAQDRVNRDVSTESPLITTAITDIQRILPLLLNSLIHVREAPPANTENLERNNNSRDGAAGSSTTIRTFPEAQRNQSPGVGSASNEQEATIPVFSGLSTQPSFISEAVPEMQGFHLTRFRIATDALEEASPTIMRDIVIGIVPAESAIANIQRNMRLLLGSPINVRGEIPSASMENTARNSINRVGDGESSMTLRAYPDARRNRPRRLTSPMNGQEQATATTTQNRVTSSVSTQSSLTTREASDTQRKRRRRKRSYRFSYVRNTKRTARSANIQNQDSTVENQPPNVDTPGEYECVICLDTTHYTQMKTLPCGHVFHRICINTWLNTNSVCPVCREATPSISNVRIPLNLPTPAYPRLIRLLHLQEMGE